MGKKSYAYLAAFCLITTVISANVGDPKTNATVINKAGSIAAGFSQVGVADVDAALVDEKFSALGPRIQRIARQWAKDEELRNAPPAFRRFLFFEYLTNGTNIVAGSSNPPDRLINIDASVDNLIPDEEVAEEAKRLMDQTVTEPVFSEVGNYHLATFPMIPSADNASKCIACHASTEVNRPYPPGAHVLGYTFVVQPR